LWAPASGNHFAITPVIPTYIARHPAHPLLMPTRPGSQVLRKGRRSIPGQIYLLTSVAAHRRPLFANPRIAEPVCEAIRSTTTWGDATLLCWVLMPDHWHGLVQLANDDLPTVMRRFKSLSTKRSLGSSCNGLWAQGFHDRALRQDENLLTAARYIVANPVRAGLVQRVRDYPYWGAVWA
jgi:putative transposase